MHSLSSVTPAEARPIASTDGNLVHALDGKNPSRLILSRIQNLSDQAPAANVDASLLIKEEDEFYLGVHRGDEAEVRIYPV